MTTSAASTTKKNNTKSNNNGFIPSFDKLKLRTKKNDKIYYRDVIDPKSGQHRRIKNRLKDKPLFTRVTREIYGYYCRLHNMGNGFLSPNYKTIMEKCDCSKASVTAANDILTEYNLIGIQRTGRANMIVIVPLDDDGYPIESSAEYEVARALNDKYRKQLSCPQNPTFQDSEGKKVDVSYNNKIQSKREFKKSAEPERPPEKPDPPPPEKPPASDLDRIKDALPKKCLFKIKNIGEKIEASINANGFDYTLWAAKESHSKKTKCGSFIDMINNREKYNKYDRKVVREGEDQAIAESREHKRDIKHLAKVFKSVTDKGGIDFQAKKEAFLEYVSSDEFLKNRFIHMSDDQLKSDVAFRNFKCKES